MLLQVSEVDVARLVEFKMPQMLQEKKKKLTPPLFSTINGATPRVIFG